MEPIMGSRPNRLGDPIGGVLFGKTRQAVLRLFFNHVDERFYQRQILRLIGLGAGAVQRDLLRLTRAGILVRTMEGRQTYYQVNRHCSVFEELRGLIRKTFGVAQVLQAGLQPIADRIRLAFIYGSIARSSETAVSDVDIIVVADRLSLGEVVSALAGAQTELGREVNPSVYPVGEFCRKLADGHHFLSEVMAGPKIFLIGDERELTRLAEIRVAQTTQREPARNRRASRRRRPRSLGL